MAVREFDGVDDNIVSSPGALSGMTYGTIAALVKRTDTTTGDSFFVTHDSGGSLGIYIQWTQFGDLEYGQNFSAVHITGAGTSGVWRLIVVRKAAGASTPRFSVYDYTATTWTHSDSIEGANGDPGAPGSGGTIDFNAAGNFPAARVAVRAAWSNTVKWSTDGTGDSAIETSGLHTALANWVTAAPSALWSYDQASTATAVPDLIGSANQSSITGTTVVTGDDPPGFNFNLGPALPAAVQAAQAWPGF